MGKIVDMLVPDIGDFSDVPVIELLVAVGDELSPDTAVVTLESDKASMEVPSEVNGVVTEVVVQEGDIVSEGSVLLRYRLNRELTDIEPEMASADSSIPESVEVVKQVVARQVDVMSDEPVVVATGKKTIPSGPASPAVRRLARELGVILSVVNGSGPKGRIRKDDIRTYVKQAMQEGGRVSSVRKEPYVDFSKFGEIIEKPLSRIQSISGSQLAGNWAAIPHVTSFDEADITDLDSFRRELNCEQTVKLTLLSFLIKAAQFTLQDFPQLNSSLQGETLIIKKYYHIGFAVDTPGGLMVAVIRDVDKKGVMQIAAEVKELALLARDGKLKPEQMQGGTFTISSLGSIGGTHFTPIINAPEVAILALGKTSTQPVWDGSQFLPRLKLPLSLSWDHRALDGVTASRFNVRLCSILEDFRRVIL